MPGRKLGLVACWFAVAPAMACTAQDEGRSADADAGSSPTVTAVHPESPRADPFATTEVTEYRHVGELSSITRGPGGITLLQFSMRDWTKSAFRVYDRHWRPLTPLLRVETSLEMLGRVPEGSIGRASTAVPPDGATWTNRWVIIDRAGQVRATTGPSRADEPWPLRGTDVPLPTARQRAYRPGADAVFNRLMPTWYQPRAVWYPSPNGSVCTFDRISPRVGDELRTSTTSGRTWQQVPTTALTTATGPRLQWCEATPGQVTLTTGDSEYPLWVHTLDRATGRPIASHELGGSLDPYNLAVLHDGTLVAHTNRRGLMVGDSPRNERMKFRPGPGVNPTFVVGRDLIETNLHPRSLRASIDAAKSWTRYDLAMPD